ncbi:MAG: hypothetical protein ACI93E_000462, partial [Flavobacteriales bacterium]
NYAWNRAVVYFKFKNEPSFFAVLGWTGGGGGVPREIMSRLDLCQSCLYEVELTNRKNEKTLSVKQLIQSLKIG